MSDPKIPAAARPVTTASQTAQVLRDWQKAQAGEAIKDKNPRIAELQREIVSTFNNMTPEERRAAAAQKTSDLFPSANTLPVPKATGTKHSL